MLRALTKTIDLTALSSNYDYIKKVCGKSQVMVVVKSDAYGHGMLRISKSLSQADGFSVACVSEAIALRHAGVTQKILILQGCYSEQEMENAKEYQLSVVCHNRHQLEWLKQIKGQGIEVWVKFDTGMHRLGFPVAEHAEVMECILNLSGLTAPPVLMSHFSCADDPSDATTRKQVKIFQKIHKCYKADNLLISLANSAAALRWEDLHHDWVRSGIAVYGCTPPNADEHDEHLTPVMTLIAPIIAIKDLKKGNTVGYGGEHVCQKNTRVGVIAIGYGDGYSRLTQDTPVWINGQYRRLVGRVSMDMIAIDLEDSDAQIGDTVELWGKNLSVATVAHSCGTIPYELLCSVSATGSVLS